MILTTNRHLSALLTSSDSLPAFIAVIKPIFSSTSSNISANKSWRSSKTSTIAALKIDLI
jgi:hypothetical protein